MAKGVSFRRQDVAGPPKGQTWCWHTLELQRSPAWRGCSINCRRFIEFLEIEHMQHSGLGNGKLLATYDQLVEFGITRRLIKQVIDEAKQRGLVDCAEPALYRGAARAAPTRYRLTYWATREKDDFGRQIWRAPTDEWKSFKPESESLVPERKLRQYPKGNSHGIRVGTTAPGDAENKQGSAPFSRRLPLVSEGEPLSISRPPSSDKETSASIAPEAGDRVGSGQTTRRCGLDKNASLRTALRVHLKAAGRGAGNELAASLNISQSHLANILCGRRRMTSEIEARLAAYLAAPMGIADDLR